MQERDTISVHPINKYLINCLFLSARYPKIGEAIAINNPEAEIVHPHNAVPLKTLSAKIEVK